LPEALKNNYAALHEATLKNEARVMSEKLTPEKLVQLLDQQQKMQATMMWLTSIGKKIEANSKIIKPNGAGLLSSVH